MRRTSSKPQPTAAAEGFCVADAVLQVRQQRSQSANTQQPFESHHRHFATHVGMNRYRQRTARQ